MGKKKQTTTQTYTPPTWVENSAQTAMGIGNRIANTNYTPYSGQRVAGLSENEQQGVDLAASSVGNYQPYLDESRALAQRGTQQFTEANMQDYMNPYIHSALDPAAREIRDQGARTINDLDARAASMNAFGGSRSALMRSEAIRNTDEAVGDLYKRGLSDAYDRATSIWGEERARDLAGAGRIQDIGMALQNASQTDISTLMATGSVDRGLQQAMLDFDYQQFVEDRDWDFRQLTGILTALEGTKGSYTTVTKEEQEKKTNTWGSILGIISTAVGAYYGGMGSAEAGSNAAGD